jgi:transmembrane sensor
MSDAFRPILPDDPDARWEVIARSLADESTPAEAEAVVAWLALHPEDAAMVALVQARAARAEARAAVTVNAEHALAAVRARLDAPPLSVSRGGAPRVAPSMAVPATGGGRWRGIGFAVAAGLVAIIGIAQFRGSAGDPMKREYRTAVGQRDSIRLPDGTTVVLAPGSRLTLAATFGDGARDVTLEGAAFFEVQHDAAHPFTVRTRDAEIRDIGTAFTVKTAADGGVSVSVTHGIVSLRSGAVAPTGPSALAELRAGDRGTIAKGTVVVRRGVVTADDMAWTRGQLAYRDAPLSEVQADLRRWYGIELRVTDSVLAQRTITATFRGDSAAQVVQLIALALGADAVQRGDTVLLQPQASGTPTP